MKKLKSLSVFFPVYNEEQNIPLFLEQALKFIPTIANRYEIIVINDGSNDNSKKITQQFAKKHQSVKVYSHQKNKGYGAALRTGFDKSKYEWIFFTDGDLQFDIKQLKKFIPYTQEYDVIIGYRKNRAEGKFRALNAKLFKIYIDLLYRLRVKDIDCAFKLIRNKTLKSVELVSSGAFTTSELLYKLKKKGFKFKQIGVTHHLRKFGKPTGNNLKVIIKAGFEALKLYLAIKFGQKK